MKDVDHGDDREIRLLTLAVAKPLNVEVPERTKWVRTMFGEITRILGRA